MAAFFSAPAHWGVSSLGKDSAASANYLGLSIPDFQPAHEPFMFVSNMGQPTFSSTDEKPARSFASSDVEQPEPSADPSSTSFSHAVTYSSPTSFTAMNANDAKMQDVYTLSPLQTHFDGDTLPYESSSSFSADASMQSATSSTFGQWPRVMEQDTPTQSRRGSTRSDGRSTSGRRRKSENVEPGSARAVYLEKNRKAASKCRSKQKKQQEDLVEAAREVERRNKALKSEVELLKSDLRDLMQLVGKHHECPDGRLRQFIQREADRLAARGDQSEVAELLSSNGSSSGSASPEDD